MSKLEELLNSKSLENISEKVLIADIWTDDKILMDFSYLLKYWSILLTSEETARSPEFCSKYVDILVALSRVEMKLKDKVANYFCSLEANTLKDVSIFEKYFQQRIEEWKTAVTLTIANSNK